MAYQVAVSSREKSKETTIRCLCPNASLIVSINKIVKIPSDVGIGNETWVHLHTSSKYSSSI